MSQPKVFRLLGGAALLLGTVGLNHALFVVGAILLAGGLGPIGARFGPDLAVTVLITSLLWTVAFLGLITVGFGLLGIRAWVIRPARWLALYSMVMGLAEFTTGWVNAAGAPLRVGLAELAPALVLIGFSLGLAAAATRCHDYASRVRA